MHGSRIVYRDWRTGASLLYPTLAGGAAQHQNFLSIYDAGEESLFRNISTVAD